MKDPKDRATRDAFEAPKRGRPVTGNAKSGAQRAREFRRRRRAEMGKVVSLTADERSAVLVAVRVFITQGLGVAEDLPHYQSVLSKLDWQG